MTVGVFVRAFVRASPAVLALAVAVGCRPKPEPVVSPVAGGTPGTGASEPAPARPERFYGGEVIVAGMPAIEFYLHLSPREDESGGWAATLDLPTQLTEDAPVDELTVGDDGAVEFTLASVDARWKWTPRDIHFDCEFVQRGIRLPCEVMKLDRDEWTELRVPDRPQTPRPPFDYDVEAFEVERSADAGRPETGAHLEGTLTRPRGVGPFPAVVLVTGSGSQDRDETIFAHKPFAVIADHLTGRGLAVLRLDDRGVGGSAGAVDVTSADLANDIRAAMRSLAERPDVDARRIGVLGHSEGAMIAPMIAADPGEAPAPAFVVLLAGPAVPSRDLLLRQSELIAAAAGADEAELRQNEEVSARVFDAVLGGIDDAEVATVIERAIREVIAAEPAAERPPPGAVDELVENQVTMVTTRWFRYFLAFDPSPVLARVRCPVLALTGALDLQVEAAQNVDPMRAALRKARNKDVTVETVPGLNHLFQPAVTGEVTEYATITTTFDPATLARIGDWVVAHSKPAP